MLFDVNFFIFFLRELKIVAFTRGPAEEQLSLYAKTVKDRKYITTGYGVPIGNTDSILAVDNRYVVMPDSYFFDRQAHFNRERIPERVVHVNVKL